MRKKKSFRTSTSNGQVVIETLICLGLCMFLFLGTAYGLHCAWMRFQCMRTVFEDTTAHAMNRFPKLQKSNVQKSSTGVEGQIKCGKVYEKVTIRGLQKQ